MQNNNDNRFFKKDGKTVNKKYIAKKHSKEVNQKLFSKLFVFFLVLLALLAISFNIYFHPYMHVADVYISGNHAVSDTEIIGKLKNPIGKNILFYNPKDYENDIRDMEYIEDVNIKKVFPNLINVRITENYPLFKASTDSGTYYISNDGKILNLENVEDSNRLVALEGARLKTIPGENFTTSDASLKFILSIQDYPYFNEVKQLNLENKADIGIMVNDINVRFGDLNNISYKLKLLDKILVDISQKGVTAKSIDLDNGVNPTVEIDS